MTKSIKFKIRAEPKDCMYMVKNLKEALALFKVSVNLLFSEFTVITVVIEGSLEGCPHKELVHLLRWIMERERDDPIGKLMREVSSL